MKTTGDDSAFGFNTTDLINGTHERVNSGLTKREYFAAIAMQGLSAHYGLVKNPHEAIELADALIAELNKDVK